MRQQNVWKDSSVSNWKKVSVRFYKTWDNIFINNLDDGIGNTTVQSEDNSRQSEVMKMLKDQNGCGKGI